MLMFAPLRSVAVSLCAVALALVAAPEAHGQFFSNNAAITIPTSGTASPYPSTITVSGAPVAPAGLRVRLQNFSHTFPSDVAVLLVAPSGQGFQLLNGNGGSNGVSGLFVTISSSSSTPLPAVLTSGIFAPAGGNTTFSSPANAIPRAASLAALATGNVNGQWRLFVTDVESPDGGTIAGGWELEFESAPVPTTPAAPFAFTYQGRLDGGVIDGTIDARFTLFSSATSNAAANTVSLPVTLSGLTVTDRLFNATVDFGRPLPSDVKTWLQVEIASPAGSAFVPLTPRQPLTATPLAGTTSSLALTTLVPAGNSFISGPQGVFQTGSLTLRAPGAAAADNSGSLGGLLRLVAGNANTASSPPSVGASANNDVHIVAGDNVFNGTNFDRWNGNIQFFAGDNQPERMRIVGDNGFVGIGTSNPGQTLDVRGSIALGTTGELRAASGEENLRMLRGTLNANGTIFVGSGFTASRTGTGTYVVNFNTAFSTLPTITFTPQAASLYVFVTSTTPSSVTLNVRNTFNVATDAPLNFIAIGPR